MPSIIRHPSSVICHPSSLRRAFCVLRLLSPTPPFSPSPLQPPDIFKFSNSQIFKLYNFFALPPKNLRYIHKVGEFLSESVKEVFKRVILLLVMLIIISATAGSCARRNYSGYHGANRVRSLPHKKWKQPKSRYKEPKKNYSMNQDVLWIESYDRAVSHSPILTSSASSSSRLDPRLAVGSRQLAVRR